MKHWIREEIKNKTVELSVEEDGEVSFLVDGLAYRTSDEGNYSITKFLLKTWAQILKDLPECDQKKLYCIPQEWQGGVQDGVNRANCYGRLGFKHQGRYARICVSTLWQTVPCLSYGDIS